MKIPTQYHLPTDLANAAFQGNVATPVTQPGGHFGTKQCWGGKIIGRSQKSLTQYPSMCSYDPNLVREFSKKTLPEAQRTQGIETVT